MMATLMSLVSTDYQIDINRYDTGIITKFEAPYSNLILPVLPQFIQLIVSCSNSFSFSKSAADGEVVAS